MNNLQLEIKQLLEKYNQKSEELTKIQSNIIDIVGKNSYVCYENEIREYIKTINKNLNTDLIVHINYGEKIEQNYLTIEDKTKKIDDEILKDVMDGMSKIINKYQHFNE